MDNRKWKRKMLKELLRYFLMIEYKSRVNQEFIFLKKMHISIKYEKEKEIKSQRRELFMFYIFFLLNESEVCIKLV